MGFFGSQASRDDAAYAKQQASIEKATQKAKNAEDQALMKALADSYRAGHKK